MTSCRSVGNIFVKEMAFAMVLVLSFSVAAKTTTWKGGAGPAEFALADNWTDGAPEPGDTVKFTTVSGITGNFDLGDKTLIIENTATVSNRVVFSGTGGIIIRSSSTSAPFRQETQNMGSFTGGLRIEKGRFSIIYNGSNPTTAGAASSPVTVVRPANFYLSSWVSRLANDLVIDGDGSAASWEAVRVGNPGEAHGTVTANTDFAIASEYKEFTAKKDVVATGHTITCNMGAYDANFEKKVDASIVWKGKGTLTLSGTSPNADNALELQKGTCVMSSSAVWGGTNIIVKGAGTRLKTSATSNLSPDAILRVSDGGLLEINGRVSVSELYVDGERMPSGLYSAANLPTTVVNGELTVGLTEKTWIGGATGDFAAAENWSDTAEPKPGDLLVFKAGVAEVTLTGAAAFDVGDAGIILDIASGVKVVNNLEYLGSGAIRLIGAGTFYDKKAGSFCGGLRLLNGSCGFGNGNWTTFKKKRIDLVSVGTQHAKLNMNSYGAQMRAEIFITGGNTSPSTSIVLEDGSAIDAQSVIHSDCDFKVESNWSDKSRPVGIAGKIDAPGKTMTLTCHNSWANLGVNLSGEIDASVVKTGAQYLQIGGNSPNPDNSLSVSGVSNIVAKTAYWGGTNIVVTGSATTLDLKARGTISKDAVIRLVDGGKVRLDRGVGVHVAELYVGSERIPDGRYTATSLPSAIAGEGRLTVGLQGLFLIVR